MKENTNLFNQDELKMLSDGMLNLIRSTNEVLNQTYDGSSIEALKKATKKYQELNTKICNIME